MRRVHWLGVRRPSVLTDPLRADDYARLLASPLADDLPGDRVAGRPTAVLLVIYDRGPGAHVLLTKRSMRLPAHPGQVSLPGGMYEEDDASLMATALRETQEEVGIAPEQLRVLGRLGDVHTVATDFLIRPFVAVANGPLTPIVASDEVARIMEVSIAEILRIDASLPPGDSVATTRYPLDGEDVWGATARILRRFSAVTRHALDGRTPTRTN